MPKSGVKLVVAGENTTQRRLRLELQQRQNAFFRQITMTNIPLTYPVMGFTSEDSYLHVYTGNELCYSSKGQKFYRDLELIDSEGIVYILKKSKLKGRANFWVCLRHLQPIQEFNIVLNKMDQMTLNELKDRILSHVSKHPKVFAPLYDGTPWKERIGEFDSFGNLIKLFK